MSNETQINLAGAGVPGIDHRVTIVERDLKTLGESVTREFAEVRKDGDARHADLKGMLQGLSAAQAERSKIPWQAIGVVVGILVALGGLVYRPIEGNQSEMKESLKELKGGYVSEKELLGVMGAIKDRRDDQQRVGEARFARIEGDVDGLQKAVVPRGELEANWAAQRARDTELQRQLDDQRTRVESIYSPRDAITSLQHTVEDLQRAQVNGSRR